MPFAFSGASSRELVRRLTDAADSTVAVEMAELAARLAADPAGPHRVAIVADAPADLAEKAMRAVRYSRRPTRLLSTSPTR